jgi:orotidine-5'-phosphate decarboxylase
MTASQKLHQRQQHIQSRLCIGLDPDERLLPAPLRREADPWRAFLREILAATLPYTCAYKLNIAFYAQFGSAGWKLLEDLVSLIPSDVCTIADIKHGDVPHTAAVAARTFFERMGVDAVTLNPLLGADSVAPFLGYEGKLAFVLARTSNTGAEEFFDMLCADGRPLYQHIVHRALSWERRAELGFVVGATAPDDFSVVRRLAPHAWLLVPGIGAQGGDLASILRANAAAPLLIAVGRAVLYASTSIDFADAAARAAAAYARATWSTRGESHA